MATETSASDHASTTDEQYVKNQKDESIAQKIASLANEDEVKHDKPDDTPSSKTEEDVVKAELAAADVEKSDDDSPALEASAEDSMKHDRVEEAQSATTPPTEGDDHKVEPAVAVEKIEDSVPSDESVVAVEHSVKEEKEVVPDSHTISDIEPVHQAPSTDKAVEETLPQELEKEPVETDEEKQVQPKTEDVPKASAETVEKPRNTDETSPLIESEGEVVKEAQVLETSAQVEEKPETEAAPVQEKPEKQQPSTVVAVPEPVATQVEETTEEPERELQEAEKPSIVAVPEPVATQLEEKTEEPEKESQEAEKPTTVAVPEPVATQVEEKTEESSAVPEPSAEKKPSDNIEEKATGPSEDVVEETKNSETGPTETVEIEHVVPEVDESQKEPEKQSLEQKEEEEKQDTSAFPEPSEESGDAIEVKTRELEFEAELLKETNNSGTEKAEPVEAKVDENQSEIEKTELVAAKFDENQSEPEKQEEEEQPKTVVPETEAESKEQLENIVEGHPPKDSGIDEVKDTDTGNSEPEAVPEKTEKPVPLSTEVEEKPREQLQVDEEVAEAGKEVETKQEIVLETAKSEETSAGTVTEEKTDKKEETSLTENAAQVLSNVEPQQYPVETSPEVVLETSNSEETSADTVTEEEASFTVNAAQVSSNEEPQASIVEPSPEVAQKVVEEVDDKKESSNTDVIEAVSNEAGDIMKTPEQASIDEEAKTDKKEEREISVPAAVEEKVAVAVAAIDDVDKKEPEAPNVAPESSQEEEVESKKVEEQNEAKAATTEAVESVNVDNDSSVVDDKKEEKTDSKVEEIYRAINETVRETLASKFEEETVEPGADKVEKEQTVEPEKTEEVQATKETDATKTSKNLPKETPAKPAQKQSNNIISKVKQSLVKAKKAITGKSPSSKNLSSDPKGDIKVK